MTKVGALLELEDLLLHGSAAIDSHNLDALLVPGELLHLSGGLHGQLPGGTERQHLDALEVGIDHLNGGRPKAAVLPVPVWERPITSFPSRISGMLWAWMGVGSV